MFILLELTRGVEKWIGDRILLPDNNYSISAYNS